MYDRLKKRIYERKLTRLQIADAIGIDKVTLWRKLNGRNEWTRNEMESICRVLEIDLNDIDLYFFNKKVAKWKQGGKNEENDN